MLWNGRALRFCFPPNGLAALLQQWLPVTTSEQISVRSHDISWVRPLWLPDSQMLLLFAVTRPCILVLLHFYCWPLQTELDFSYNHWRTKVSVTVTQDVLIRFRQVYNGTIRFHRQTGQNCATHISITPVEGREQTDRRKKGQQKIDRTHIPEVWSPNKESSLWAINSKNPQSIKNPKHVLKKYWITYLVTVVNRREETEIEENNAVTEKRGKFSLKYTRGHVNERQVQHIIVIKSRGSMMSVNTQNTFKIKQESWNRQRGINMVLNSKSTWTGNQFLEKRCPSRETWKLQPPVGVQPSNVFNYCTTLSPTWKSDSYLTTMPFVEDVKCLTQDVKYKYKLPN